MNSIIQNRYDFLYLFDVSNGNPNGDPDTGNAPRMDPEDMHGLVSDVAIKRKIRNYVQISRDNESPYAIFITHDNVLNRVIQQAHKDVSEQYADKYKKAKDDRQKNLIAQAFLKKTFYDVRTFGAVMSTNKDADGKKTTKNAGQVKGAVQIGFSRSFHPILPLDISITRMAVATHKEEKDRIEKGTENQTMGRKNIIPYGLYACQGFVSAHLAGSLADKDIDTGFSTNDLSVLWESLQKMFYEDPSASRFRMASRGLFVFKHVGTDKGNEEQCVRQAKLGCAAAHKLIDPWEDKPIVEVTLKKEIKSPKKFADYNVTVHKSRIPDGVELLEDLMIDKSLLNILEKPQ